MNVADEIHSAIKSNNAIIGYRKSVRYLKLSSPKFIVIANNAPDSVRENIEHGAKVAGVKMEVFDGNSNELGVFCGKPFPVTVMVIK